VLDDFSRGKRTSVPDGVQLCQGDIRNPNDLRFSTRGLDEVIHLAYINGTKTFYEQPGEVLDVGVRGMLNLLDACKLNNIRRMMLVSSSEVCRADVGGMNEDVPLVIPDPFNPRYSYSAGKIVSEMLAIHSGLFDHLTILRPFNIYGPGMSAGHVIPDFRKQIEDKITDVRDDPLPFDIIGCGDETRSFCYIDDFIDGAMTVRAKGKHRGIYNIGTPEETTIRELAQMMGAIYGFELDIIEGGGLREGSIKRRKPDISKLMALGYAPKVSLQEGLRRFCRADTMPGLRWSVDQDSVAGLHAAAERNAQSGGR
jgi:nucleoside-diphosphate-sugar epimerase